MAEPNGSAAVAKPASPALEQPSLQSTAPTSAPAPATSPPPASQPQQSSQPTQPITAATNGPTSSLADPGTSTRPHDARTIHMVLASLGVTAYQERVPLQLLDFAYRYTASVLADAQHLAAEGYVSSASGGGGASGGKAGSAALGGEQISLAALRLATSSRLGYQFSSGLPKQTLLDLARDRNKIQLPDPGDKVVFGLNLPHERFVQTGTNWAMLEEWDSEGAAEGEEDGAAGENGTAAANGDGGGGDGEDKDEDMQDGFEDVFGGEDEDKAMEDD